MTWHKRECIVWRVIFCLLILAVIQSFAYSGKIWTASADATVSDVTKVTNDANGNWALIGDGDADSPGTLTNGPTWNSQANSKLGVSSVMFDGTNDYINITNSGALNLTNFSVEVWVKWTSGLGY